MKKPSRYGGIKHTEEWLEKEGPKLSPEKRKELRNLVKTLEKKRKSGELVEGYALTDYSKESSQMVSIIRYWVPRGTEISSRSRAEKLVDKGVAYKTHELLWSAQVKGKLRSDEAKSEYTNALIELYENSGETISREQAGRLVEKLIKSAYTEREGKLIPKVPKYKEKAQEIVHSHWEVEEILRKQKGISQEELKKYLALVVAIAIPLFVVFLGSKSATGIPFSTGNSAIAILAAGVILILYFYFRRFGK